jgi:hypothetical protein
MANKFVWSGAGGANDGSSWNNAYTSLMRDWGAEGTFTPATDFIYVRSVHAESTAGILEIRGSTVEGSTAPCRVLCVVGDTTGTTPGALAIGASVTTTGVNDLNVLEGLYVYGVDFFSSDDMEICPSSATDDEIGLEECSIKLTEVDGGDHISIGGNNNNVSNTVRWKNVDVDFSHAGQGISGLSCQFVWEGGTVGLGVNSMFVLFGGLASPVWEVRGVDFSSMTGNPLVIGSAPSTGRLLIISRCLTAPGGTIVSGTIDIPGFRVESYHCQGAGGVDEEDPAYQMEIQDRRGKIVTDKERYRTGGGWDGHRQTEIAWDMDTTIGSVRGYPGNALEAPPIAGWTLGDGVVTQVYRIAIASDATINDDELWMTLEGPNDAAKDSMSVFRTSRVAPETAASALATDSVSTWTGTGVGTKQYLEVSYVPDKPGPIFARIHMAKASDNIYIDPHIQVNP